MYTLPKTQALDKIEKEIILCLDCAGYALQELSKEKPSQKNLETQTQQLTRSLKNVEKKLGEQINNLTQVSKGHEGSAYDAAKDLQMANYRISHARSRVRKLEETKVKHTDENRQLQQEHAARKAAAAAQQQMAQQQHQQSHRQDTSLTGGSNAGGGSIMPQDVRMQQRGEILIDFCQLRF